MTRLIALIAALACASAHAYLGSFDPQPLRHEVRITFVDSQLPGPQCIAEAPSIKAPLVLTAMGCAIYDKGVVILPINPGIGWLAAAQALATPNALLGHETRHLFDGDFHPDVLPYVERVRRPDRAAGSVVPGEQHGGDVRADEGRRPERGDDGERLHASASASRASGAVRCTIFTGARDVSYEDFGALVRACVIADQTDKAKAKP